jgi:hypothetical protein
VGLFARLLGTTASFFQLGGPSAPRLKNNGGSIDARNSSDSAYVNVRGADPVIANDLVTLEYANATYDTLIDLELAADLVVNANYTATYTGNRITNELWVNPSNSHSIKNCAYTYTGSKLTQEVRTVYAADGVTIVGEVTYTYAYTGSKLTSGTITRNV